jgi:hypothetical protein
MTTKPLLQKVVLLKDSTRNSHRKWSKPNHKMMGSIKPQEKKRQVIRE